MTRCAARSSSSRIGDCMRHTSNSDARLQDLPPTHHRVFMKRARPDGELCFEPLRHEAHRQSDLGRARLTAELLDQIARDVGQAVDDLGHVHGHADRAGLVGDGATDGLADPPRGVRAELEAAAMVELLDRAHQAEVAFLNQVEQRQSAAEVFLGHADDEPQVRLDQPALGALAAARASRRSSRPAPPHMPRRPGAATDTWATAGRRVARLKRAG